MYTGLKKILKNSFQDYFLSNLQQVFLVWQEHLKTRLRIQNSKPLLSFCF